MNQNYLTISEFAKRAGVSRQAVYSQLDKRLSEYFQVYNGKKVINIAALRFYKRDNAYINNAESTHEREQDVNNVLVNELAETVNQLTEDVNRLTAEVERLKAVLTVKDMLIASQRDTIEHYREHQDELTKSLQAEQARSMRLQLDGSTQHRSFFARLFRK